MIMQKWLLPEYIEELLPGEAARVERLRRRILDLFFSHASNGATFTDVDRQHLYRIKYRQIDPETLDEELTAA